jgi:hypothetical protein
LHFQRKSVLLAGKGILIVLHPILLGRLRYSFPLPSMLMSANECNAVCVTCRVPGE